MGLPGKSPLLWCSGRHGFEGEPVAHNLGVGFLWKCMPRGDENRGSTKPTPTTVSSVDFQTVGKFSRDWTSSSAPLEVGASGAAEGKGYRHRPGAAWPPTFVGWCDQPLGMNVRFGGGWGKLAKTLIRPVGPTSPSGRSEEGVHPREVHAVTDQSLSGGGGV